jgi:hypothetical protein
MSTAGAGAAVVWPTGGRTAGVVVIGVIGVIGTAEAGAAA